MSLLNWLQKGRDKYKLHVAYIQNYVLCGGRMDDGTDKSTAKPSESENNLDDPQDQPSSSGEMGGVSEEAKSTSPGPSVISG